MFTLPHLDTPSPESMKTQVLQMVVAYLGDISAGSRRPGNPQHGADAMVEAERQRDRLLDEMTAQAAHLMRTAMADRRMH